MCVLRFTRRRVVGGGRDGPGASFIIAGFRLSKAASDNPPRSSRVCVCDCLL